MSTITTCTDLREAALWYAQHGFRVFPVAPRDKAPLLPGHGYHDATDDEQQVRDWWAKYPNANIGLACDANDLLVLDVDTHEADGFATLAELCGDHELVTPTADTGGGGRHLLFTLPDYETRGTAGPGLDVKRPGYIVAPPSIHSSGRAYRWRYGSAPGEVPIAPVPDWLETAIRRADYVPPAPVDDYRAIAATGGQHDDAQVSIEALRYLPPGAVDDYDAWLAVGMALHAAVCDCSEWDTWSRQNPKWLEGDCERRWRGFTANGGVGVGTLVAMARETEPNFLRPGWRSRQAPRRANAATAPQAAPGRAADDAAQVDLADGAHCRPGDHRCDDIGNAERFAELCGARFRYCCEWQTWLAYDGTRWALDTAGAAMIAARAVARSILREAWAAEGDDRSAIAKHASQSARRGQLEAMLFLARGDLPVHSYQLDTNPDLLNALNGTVDLRTGQLRPHNPADMITRCASSAYVPDADLADTPGAVEWRRFIAGIANNDDELAAYLQRAAGYSVTGNPCEEVLFFAYGPERTGKSTFLVTITHHLADYADQVDFTAFLRKRDDSELKPELAKLQGKRFVASSETSAGRTLAEGLVKTITGNEPISVRTLNKPSDTWQPAFTLWLAANDRPIVRHDDGPLWRRLKVVPFVHQVPAEAVDTGLKARLRKTAGEAVLAWLVRGCQTWAREGLGTCSAVDAAIEGYREEMDPIGGWLADCCDVRIGHDDWFTPTDLLYRSFKSWCDESGEPLKLTQKQFGQHLSARKLTKTQRRSDGRRRHGYNAIRLTEQPELGLDDED